MEWLYVLGFTVLALALRLFAVGHESIWYDEAFSLQMAAAGPCDLARGRLFDPGNPQGYFLLLSCWLRLWHSSSIETARALSGLVGALGVPAVWLLSRYSGSSRRTRLLACLLAAASPPLVYLGQEARVFALFATVATLAAAAAASIARRGDTTAWLAFAVEGAILVHMHYYGPLVLVALGLYLLAWAWRHDRAAVWKLGAAAVFVALTFAPWLPIFRRQLVAGAARSAETWWQHLALLPLFSVAGRTLVWKTSGLGLVIAADLAVLAALYAPIACLLWRSRLFLGSAMALGLGLPALAGVVSVVFTPMVHLHYLAAAVPPLLLLIAAGLDAGLRRRYWVMVLSPTLVLGLLGSLALLRVYGADHKTDWRGLAERVAECGPNLIVYCYEDIGSLPFRYYRSEQTVQAIAASFGSDGRGWEREQLWQRLHAEPDGFWLAFYATNRDTRTEEDALVQRLASEFLVDQDERFGVLRLLRCRPRP